MRSVRPSARPDVTVVTTARVSHQEDLAARRKKYLLAQLLRLTFLMFATLAPVSVPVKILLMAAAVVLPWMGVVAANGRPVVDRKRNSALIDGPAVEVVARPALGGARVIDAEP